jgi:SAM-dependent methyltransferase
MSRGNESSIEKFIMYDQLAQFYDKIHEGLGEEIDFYTREAEAIQQPILELGCGTGRILIPLAEQGKTITGVDNSAAMLAKTSEKLADFDDQIRNRVTLVSANMASFELSNRYGLVIVSRNSLFHLNKEKRRSCLRQISEHLLQGGKLIIDVDNPILMSDPIDSNLMILERKMIDDESGDLILQTTSSRVDAELQKRHYTWIFDSSPTRGGPVNRTVITSVFHYVFSHQLELELTGAGLKLVSIYGDYEFNDYREDSSNLIMMAELSLV